MRTLRLLLAAAAFLATPLSVQAIAVSTTPGQAPVSGTVGQEWQRQVAPLAASQVQGQLQYSIPVSLPAGRRGMQPSVSVQYQQGAAFAPSLLAGGWQVDMPYIQRVLRSSSQRRSSTTVYEVEASIPGFSGRLVAVSVDSQGVGTYAPLQHTEALQARLLANGTWQIETKQGHTYTFGATAASRISNAAAPSEVYRWHVTSVVDTVGNGISYTYVSDGEWSYPATISYTTHPGAPALYVVRFQPFASGLPATPRADVLVGNVGFPVAVRHRLDKITVEVAGQVPQQETVFAYEGITGTDRAKLTTVTTRHWDGAAWQAAPATQITYSNRSAGFDVYSGSTASNWYDRQAQNTVPGSTFPISSDFRYMQDIFTVDINNDGLRDMVGKKKKDSNGNIYYLWMVWINNGANGFTEYEQSQSGSWTRNSGSGTTNVNWRLPPMSALNSLITLDQDQDGIVEFLSTSPVAGTPGYRFNFVDGWVPDATLTFDVSTYGHRWMLLADVDGDGRNDKLFVKNTNYYFDPDDAYLIPSSTGQVFYRPAPTSQWQIGTTYYPANTWKLPPDTYAKFSYPGFDLNLDGLTDYTNVNATTGAATVWVHNGTNGWDAYTRTTATGTWTRDDGTVFPADTWAPAPAAGPKYYIDANADGLQDTMGDDGKIYLHNGRNGYGLTPIQLPYVGNNQGGDLVPMDVNGDGRTDFGYFPVSETIRILWLSTATGYEYYQSTQNGNNPWGFQWAWYDHTGAYKFQRNYFPVGMAYGVDSKALMLDFNGDGVDDMIDFTHGEPSSIGVNANIFLSKPGSPDLTVTGITNGIGGNFAASYGWKNLTPDGRTPMLPFQQTRIWALKRLQWLDRGTAMDTEDYTYATPLHAQPLGRFSTVFAGFGSTITTYADSSKATEQRTLVGAAAPVVRRFIVPDSISGSTPLLDERWQYTARNIGTNRTLLVLDGHLRDNREGQATGKLAYTSYTADNDGNTTLEKQWAEVKLKDPAVYCNYTFVFSGDTYCDVNQMDTRQTAYTYAKAAAGLLTVPTGWTTTDTMNGILQGRARHTYDGLPWGTVGAGLRTSTADALTGTTDATRSWTYDQFGNALTTTDPRGYTTTATYDMSGMFPLATANAKGQTTSFTYDQFFGMPLTTTDANGMVERQQLDAFGRTVGVWRTARNGVGEEQLRRASYDWSAAPISITVDDYADDTTARTTRTYFDGFGRLIATVAETNSGYTASGQAYNNRGMPSAKYLPRAASSLAFPSLSAPASQVSLLTYDALLRPKTEQTPTEYTTISYTTPWSVQVDGPSQPRTTYTFDGHGRLATVAHTTGIGSTWRNTYSNNTGRLVSQLQVETGTVREFAYDTAGRMLSRSVWARVPAAVMRYEQWQYDAAGNVTSYTDPDSKTITSTYDELGRLATRTGAGSTLPDETYSYDTAPYGIGRPSGIVGQGWQRSWVYDLWGRPISETTSIGAASYATATSFDRQGNELAVTHPDGTVVNTAYGSALQPAGVSSPGIGSLASGLQYAPSGALAQLQYGSGVQLLRSYDAAKAWRLTNQTTTAANGTTVLQQAAYTYSGPKLAGIQETGLTGMNYQAAFNYNAHQQLAWWQLSGSAGTQTVVMTYDAFGNITNRSDVGNYTYGLPAANAGPASAVTKAGTATYAYDQTGRITGNAGWIYTYGPLGTLASATHAASGLAHSYVYDNTGRRLADVRTQTTTTTDASGNPVTTTATRTTHYPTTTYTTIDSVPEVRVLLGSQHIATLRAGTPAYHIRDYLGSSSLDTDATGTITSQSVHAPYGNVYASSGTATTPHRYTSQRLEADTPLYDYGARLYDPRIGVFLQPDPWPGDALLPYTLNAHSYVLNNPVMNVDPTGMYWETAIDLGYAAYDTATTGYQWARQGYGMAKAIAGHVTDNAAMYEEGMAIATDAQGKFVDGMWNMGADAAALATPAPAAGTRAVVRAARGAENVGDVINNIRMWSTRYHPTSQASLEHHFNQHHVGVGASTIGEYNNMAQAFVNRTDAGVERITRANGDTLIYESSTRRFGIVNSDGDIATFYEVSPDNTTAQRYWDKQKREAPNYK